MVGLLLFISIYFILQQRVVLGGIFYGLSVHFKIYPIIYAIVFYMYIDMNGKLIQSN